MSFKRYAYQFKIILKQQGAFLPFLIVLIVLVFPIGLLSYYIAKDYKVPIIVLKQVEMFIPVFSLFWEVNLLDYWTCRKHFEILYYIEPNPWKQAYMLNILYDLFVLLAFGVISVGGIDTKREYIKIFLLCLIIQCVALMFLNLLKSVSLTIGASEAVLCYLIFFSKSPFYYRLADPFAPKVHLIQISIVSIVVLTAINILLFKFKDKVSQ